MLATPAVPLPPRDSTKGTAPVQLLASSVHCSASVHSSCGDGAIGAKHRRGGAPRKSPTTRPTCASPARSCSRSS